MYLRTCGLELPCLVKFFFRRAGRSAWAVDLDRICPQPFSMSSWRICVSWGVRVDQSLCQKGERDTIYRSFFRNIQKDRYHDSLVWDIGLILCLRDILSANWFTELGYRVILYRILKYRNLMLLDPTLSQKRVERWRQFELRSKMHILVRTKIFTARISHSQTKLTTCISAGTKDWKYLQRRNISS